MVLWFSLVLISCEDPGEIGLNLDADNGVVSTHYAEVVLPTTMVQFNPRLNLRSPSLQVGTYTDPDFGVVTSKSYTQLNIASFVTDVDSNAVYVDFEMQIGFSDLYGDEPVDAETVSINLFQLSEDIDTLGQYTRLSELGTNPSPLGTWSFAPLYTDTIQNDSTYLVSLDDAVGLDLFEKLKAGDPIFDDNNSFNAYFKGIALQSENTKNIFYINTTTFRLVINYHEFNSDGTEIDKTFEFNSGEYGFFHLDSDISGTPQAGLSPDNADFDPGNGFLYAQLGVMTALKIDFNAFYDITDTLDNMLINTAKISIGEIETYDDYKVPPAIMQVFFTNIDNQWPVKTSDGASFIQLQEEPVPAGFYGAPVNVGVLTPVQDSSLNTARYDIAMSTFLQNLYAGNFDDQDNSLEKEATVFFYPQTDVIFPQQFPSYTFINQFVVNKDSIKLKMFYTVPNASSGNN